MAQTQFHRPDAEKMAQTLNWYRYDTADIILRLAWMEGLTRREIYVLTWDNVDFEGGLLRLPDREIPLEAETAERLTKWKNRCGDFSEYVAVTPRRRTHMVEQSISSLARNALDRFGLEEVSLKDLRHDFILRQIAAHGYPYALRVSGISLSTYRGGEFREGESPAPENAQDNAAPDEEFALWRVMQSERTHPAGIALWLTSRLGLQSEEIVRLTWDDVDFDNGVLRAGDREVPLTVTVRHVLEDVRALRRPTDDPHVVLTPKSRRPMDAARLATVVRNALIRGGITNRTMLDYRRDLAWEAQREKLRAYVAAHGSVSRMEAAELLDLSMSQAYARLTKLAEAGELALLKARYYPAGTVIPLAERAQAVLAHIAANGPVCRKDVARLLSVGTRTAGALLRKMTEEGALELLPGTKQYALPKNADVSIS